MSDTVDEPVSLPEGGGLVRLRLDLGYDGTDFSGWASQPDRRTVQGVLEGALCTVFRLPELRLVVAGRTDAGVHATGQVAHCDLDRTCWSSEQDGAVRRLAGLLPADVRVYAVAEVSPDFDARFSALWRHYRYRITDADSGPEPLRRHDTVGWRRRLDAEAMQQAAQQLLGLHDFAAFCRRRLGASTIRQLQRLEVRRIGALIEIDVIADAFCHSMVRSLVGALAAVGEGNRPSTWPATLLALDRRCDEITVAPAHGLTLLGIGYPAADAFGERAEQTRAVRR
ncbi:MAG TPA: tRNA pseudouridine(38-40) synthase TruA [Jatrophihabitans sp.]|nr:tRNA pseudouridine(38-40) synthase TruA [Jatrophihabitans sp.]